MTDLPPDDRLTSQRVLILAPGGGNAGQAQRVLTQAGITAQVCPSMPDLCQTLDNGAGALLLTLEALPLAALERLHRLLHQQPDWSLLPVIVLKGASLHPHRRLYPLTRLQTLRGVVLLERPVHPVTLLGILSNALETRRRQYQVRDLLTQQAEDVQHRDQFLAMLGHELRNPLAPIRNLLDVFQMERHNLPKHLHDAVDLMSRQVRHLNHLVNELLDVARITQGCITLRRQRVALNPLVQEALTQVKPLLSQRGHRLHLDLPTEPLEVEGDSERLVQVVANLLVNAAKYTDAGGDIQVLCRREQGQAVLQVRDNGQGIAPDLLPRLFMPFVQAVQSPDRAVGGLGLGLALVQQLVAGHGGRVTAASAGLGQGSTFTVYLPTLAPTLDSPPLAPPGQVSNSHPPLPPLAGQRVLVVDDDLSIAEALVTLLNRLGQTARSVGSGAEALAIARDWQPQLVFLDLGMPGMDGFEVARRLRAHYGDSLYLVALSGYGQAQHRQQTREAGFDQHLLKPIALEDLHSLLKRGH